MNPDLLRECLALLRWSQRGLAAALAVDERQVRRWATGEALIPEQVAAWLERRAAAMAADPPPIRQAASLEAADLVNQASRCRRDASRF